jgi:hypothetical protein
MHVHELLSDLQAQPQEEGWTRIDAFIIRFVFLSRRSGWRLG